MTYASTLAQVFTTTARFIPLVDVRCQRCGKLAFKWEYTGSVRIEIKCGRCGVTDLISLSTSTR